VFCLQAPSTDEENLFAKRSEYWMKLLPYAFADGPDLKKATKRLDIMLTELVGGIDTKKNLEDFAGVRLRNFPNGKPRV
jgi:hypothetical protein